MDTGGKREVVASVAVRGTVVVVGAIGAAVGGSVVVDGGTVGVRVVIVGGTAVVVA